MVNQPEKKKKNAPAAQNNLLRVYKSVSNHKNSINNEQNDSFRVHQSENKLLGLHP